MLAKLGSHCFDANATVVRTLTQTRARTRALATVVRTLTQTRTKTRTRALATVVCLAHLYPIPNSNPSPTQVYSLLALAHLYPNPNPHPTPNQAVPNSLGPGELLVRYGTSAQQAYTSPLFV